MSSDSPRTFKLARRRRTERPRWSAEEVRAVAFARKVLKLAAGLVDTAIAEVAFCGARDPKILGLALLCRSISNCEGALGRQRFGVDAPAEQRLADLESTLRLIGLDPAKNAPLLSPLVDIPLASGHVANFSPEELRRRQLAAMTAWVLAGSRPQPVVL